jgi:hypothetical protein
MMRRMEEHRELQVAALQAEAEAQRRLMGGRPTREGFEEAAALYRKSWEAAPPGAYGRLVGMVKVSVIAGSAADEAAYVREAVGAEPDSPVAWYALALAALAEGDDATATRAAAGMREGGEAFANAADAIAALATADAEAYEAAVLAIVADFEGRDYFVTRIPIADTALVLECLATPRGLAAEPKSDLMPGERRCT